MAAGSQGFAEGSLGQAEAIRPRPDPVCSYQCGLSQVCLQGLSETMQSKQTKVKLKGRENQVRQNRAIRLQSARLPSMHRVQWERPPAHCQGLLLTAQWGSALEQGPCAFLPLPRVTSWPQTRADPGLPTCRLGNSRNQGHLAVALFPSRRGARVLKPSKRGRGGLQAAYMNIIWGPSILTLSHSACPAHPTAQPRTPHPFIPPLPTPDPPKPALSPLPGKPVPFPPSPHRFSAGLLRFPASKSPQFYYSPYDLTVTQQPDVPIRR